MSKRSLWLIFLLIPFSGFAQETEDSTVVAEKKRRPVVEKYYEYYGQYMFTDRNSWVNIGFGPNFYPTAGVDNANINIDFNFHHKRIRDYVFQVGYMNHAFSYILQEQGATYMHTLNAGIGKAKEWRYLKTAAFAGPSIGYTNYKIIDNLIYNSYGRVGAGLMVEAQFMFKPVYDFGIVCSPFIDINTLHPVFGVSFGIYGSNAMRPRLKG